MNLNLFKTITRWDKLIIIFLLFLALICYLLFSYSIFGEQIEGVEIFVDGKEYATYKFSEIKNADIVNIKTDKGYNVLEITSKGVKMLNASCPDKIDVQVGEISKPGQMIVCVPNKVLVRITGNSKLNVDKVTY